MLEIVSPNSKYSTKFWQSLFLNRNHQWDKKECALIHFLLVLGCGPMLSFKQSFIRNRRKLKAQHLNTQHSIALSQNHSITQSPNHTTHLLLEASPKVILYCRFLYHDLEELLYDWDLVICSKAAHGLHANFYTWKGELLLSSAKFPAMESRAQVYQAHNLRNYAEICSELAKHHYCCNVPPPPKTNKMLREALKA